jgi:replicative DNA helicase
MIEAEKAVIGCLLIDPEARDEALLSPEMFTDAFLGKLYYELSRVEGAVDTVLLRAKISADEYPDYVFNQVLNECAMSVSTSVEIEQYAKIVRDEWKKREALKIVERSKSVDEMLEKLQAIDTGASKGHTAGDLVDMFAGKRFTPQNDVGYDTGWGNIDAVLNGIFKQDICLIAARPSVGKTALGLELMIHLAMEGVSSVMFSLEMSLGEIYNRLAAYESGISQSRIQRSTSFNGMEPKYFDAGNEALRVLGKRMTFYDDLYTVPEMRRASKGYEVVIIDYAQLIKPTGSYKGNRYAEVGEISHSLKRMAKELNVAVVLLAQLNRVSESTGTKEPNMSEIRESGDFEQDASQIILLWNLEEDGKTKGVKIAKNRHGERGKTRLTFDGAVNKFFGDITDNPFV